MRSFSMRITTGLILVVLAALPARADTGAGSELRCLIKPSQVVAVGTPVEGLIESVTVDQGDLVGAGQVLAVLESSRERAAVAVAKAKSELESALKTTQVRMEYGVRKVERARDLRKTSAIAHNELDEAETELRVAEAAALEAKEDHELARLEYQRAAAELALRTIRSPITGLVVERYLTPGELVRQSPVLKVAQIHPLRVEVFAPLAWLDKIVPGMVADVVPDSATSSPYVATVETVNRVIDTANGTFGVRLHLPNPDHHIPAGLPCTVHFHTP